MRMVVDDDEGTTIAGGADNTPLRSPPVNRSVSMLLLDSGRDVTCPKVAFVQAGDCMLRPEEADEMLRGAATSDRCKPLGLKSLAIDSLPWILV